VPEHNIRKYIQDNFGQLFKTLTDSYEDDLPRFGLCLKKARFPRKTWWKNDSPVDEVVEGFLRQCEKFAKPEQVIRAFKVLVDDVQGNEVLVNALRCFEEAVEKAPAGGQRKQQGERDIQGNHAAVGNGGSKRHPTRGKHSKIVHAEEIAERLKNRWDKPHICHQDETENEKDRRVCCVQKRTIGLAKETANFDREVEKALTFTTTLQSIEDRAHGIDYSALEPHKVQTGERRVSLRNGIIRLFDLVGIPRENLDKLAQECNTGLLKETRDEAENVLFSKAGPDYSIGEFEYFFESLISFVTGRRISCYKNSSSKYDFVENLAEIKGNVPAYKNEVVGCLKDDVREAYEHIDTAMKPFNVPIEIVAVDNPCRKGNARKSERSVKD